MRNSDDAAELIPARMLNEHVYCPRLAYLEWVQGEWDDSADTVEGTFVHRRVDAGAGASVPPPDAESAGPLSARSLMLSSDRLKAIAKIDLIEADGPVVTPVDYKRGTVPDNPNRAYDPERVQLCLAGLILRDNGYSCDHGVLYFVESRTRVDVIFDDDLVELTMRSLEELRRSAAAGRMPPPLVDSPKCPRCSLVGICLPDEVNLLRNKRASRARRLKPARHDRLPVYVQEQGASIGKKGDCLSIRVKGKEVATARLREMSHLVVFGNVQVSTQALHELCDRSIPVSYLSWGGWFYGMTVGHSHKNVEARIAQHRAADNAICLEVARRLVSGKIRNQRTLLRRNLQEKDPDLLEVLARSARKARVAPDFAPLLGLEGSAARAYFGAFPQLFRGAGAWAGPIFLEGGRNRRPPIDEVNATLSFLYTLLTRDATSAVMAVGLDPYRGLFHAPRYGKPALALDLCEEFRPIIADSTCITVFNQGEVAAKDFVRRSRGVALTPSGRRTLIAAYERRMNQTVTHPIFGYRIGYRRTLEVQARLLRALLLGEVPEYVPFGTR